MYLSYFSLSSLVGDDLREGTSGGTVLETSVEFTSDGTLVDKL